MDRLFVPLKTQAYSMFATGGKLWELRRRRGRFNEQQVHIGRRVELRRGYAARVPPLWGTISDVVIAQDLQELFVRIPYREVLPDAVSKQEAMDLARKLMGIGEYDSNGLIAFRINFEST